jgi:ribokinase
VTGGSFAQHHGGKGANQAVAAARVGAEVAFVGAVGDDDFGIAARENLRIEGIELSGLLTLPGTPTGIALIVVDEAGENQIAVASGANARIDADAVRSALAGIRRSESVGVFLANFEVAEDAVVSAAQAAHEAGLTLLINPAPARELPSALLALQPILLPNEVEAAALTGEVEPVDAGRVLAGRTGAPVVVTIGPQGAIVVQDGEVERVSAPLFEAVDTTGAGDTLAGALAAELATGRPLLEAVRFAVYAASLSVTVAGARGGMPSRPQVEAAIGGQS